MRGDPTLFTRNDEVEAQWRICDPVLQAWEGAGGPGADGSGAGRLPQYEAGSQGPSVADDLLLDGHHWRAI
jgi:glucose-6-phosphate 1-dehydrogenase